MSDFDPKILEAFHEVWNRLFNPRSGCPDVELGHVSDVMVDILIAAGKDDKLTPAQQWVFAKICLHPNDRNSPAGLGMSYADRKVERYVEGEKDEYGYPKRRDYEDIDRDQAALMVEAEEAALQLVEMGLLTLEDGVLRRPGG